MRTIAPHQDRGTTPESRRVVTRDSYRLARSRLRWFKNHCPIPQRTAAVGEMLRIAAQERETLNEYWALVTALQSMKLYDFRP